MAFTEVAAAWTPAKIKWMVGTRNENSLWIDIGDAPSNPTVNTGHRAVAYIAVPLTTKAHDIKAVVLQFANDLLC